MKRVHYIWVFNYFPVLKDESTDSDWWNISSVLSIYHKYTPVNRKHFYSSSNVDNELSLKATTIQ